MTMNEEQISVLVVDDEESLRVPLKQYLEENFHYRVDEVAHGQAALERMDAIQGKYDVALIDQVLRPKPDGIEVMKMIRSRYPYVECIIFTGWGSEPRQRAQEAGAFRYIEKPFDNQDLAMLIRAAAQQVRMSAISREILTGISIEQAIQKILSAAKSLTLADEAVLKLHDRASGMFEVYQLSNPLVQCEPENHGLCSQISRNGNTVLISDAPSQTKIDADLASFPEMRSFIGTPIPGENGALGVLCVYSQKARHFEAWGSTAFLQTLAGQAGLVIANVQAFQEIRAHAGYMEALVCAAEGFTRAHSLDEMLNLAWNFVREQLHVSTFFIGLYDASHKTIGFPLAYDEGQPVTVPERPLGSESGGSGYVVETGQEILWHTAEERIGQCQTLGVKTIQVGKPCQSCFYLPLRANGEIAGVISIQSYERYAFPPILLNVFRSLGSQLTVALENVRLIEAMQHTSQQISALNHVVLELSKEVDPQALLQTIIDRAIQLLSAKGGGIYLLDPTGKTFILKAAAGLSVEFLGHSIRKNRGLSGEILRTREALSISDYSKWKKRVRELDRFRLTGVAGVPIKVGDRILGTIVVDETQPGKTFDERALALLQQLASHAGWALQKAVLLDKVQAIQKISTAITSSLEFQDVLNQICQAAVELFGVEHSGLVLLDHAQKLGIVRGEHPISVGTLDVCIPIEGVIAEQNLIYNREPLVLDDVHNNKAILGPVYDIFHRFGIRSTLIVPILYQERVLGSFSLDAIRHTRQFTPEEVEFCQVFASHVAAAVENARLHQTNNERQASLQSLFEASSAVNSSTEPDRVLHLIVEEVCKAAHAQRAAVVWMDKSGQRQMLAQAGFEPELDHAVAFRSGGISEQVIQANQPRFFPDVQSAQSEINPAMLQDGDTRAAVCLPLSLRDRAIGVLWVHFQETQAFSQFERHALQIYATQAAIAIERARELSEAQRRASLTEITLDLNWSLELEKTLETTCQRAMEFLNADHSSLVLFEPDLSYGRVRAEYPDIGTLGQIIPLMGVPVEEDLFKSKTPLIIHDVANEPGLGEAGAILRKHGVQSVVIVPVVDKNGQLLGSLGIDAIKQPRKFTPEEVERCQILADHVAVAIANARLYEDTRRHEQLLIALDEASRRIRAEKEPGRILHEVVGLAAQLVDCPAACLFVNRPHLGEMAVEVVYGLPDDLRGKAIPHTTGLAGWVTRTGTYQVIRNYSEWPEREPFFDACGFTTVVGTPFGRFGDIEAVLLIADRTPERYFSQSDLEILNRFATQATLALQTSQLMGREQRVLGQLEVLRQINEYILHEASNLEKILHVVLTGLTAGYGLGFNRAALFLLDDRREFLEGQLGIGYIHQNEALGAWAADPACDFHQYLTMLEREEVPLTPIGENTRNLKFPVASEDLQTLFQTLLKQKCLLLLESELPPVIQNSFHAAFEPVSPLIIVPLIVNEQIIGLIVADNKFTRSPITGEDQEALLTYANTAAVAINHARQFQEIHTGRELLHSFFQASSSLLSSQNLELVLQDIVQGARLASQANDVSMILIDQMHQIRKYCSTGQRIAADMQDWENTASLRVMKSNLPEIFEDTSVLQPYSVSGAGLCLPISLGVERIGVMWFYYPHSRHFPQFEIEAVQLYVNQAAVTYDSARRLRELAHLRKAAAKLAGEPDVPEVLEQIVTSARQALDADSAVIWSYDADHGTFLPNELVANGIAPQLLERYRTDGPRAGGTAQQVMDRGYIAVNNIDDKQHDYLGLAHGLRGVIGVKAFQGISLCTSDEKVGVLYVNYSQARSFNDEDHATLETFAYPAALALKRARLSRQIHLVLGQLARVRDGAQRIAHATVLGDLTQTLNSIIQAFRDVLSCDSVTLYAFDESAQKFTRVAADGCKNQGNVSQPEQLERHSTVWKVLSLPEPYYRYSYDPTNDAILSGSFVHKEKIRSTLGIQLRFENTRVGVLFLNYHSLHKFEGEYLTNALLFANQAAVAIRNAQLHEETSQRAATLQILYQAGQAMAGSLSLKDTLAQVAEQAWRLSAKRSGQRANLARFSHIALVDGIQLKFVAAYPSECLPGLVSGVGNIDLDGPGKIGITGRAVKSGCPQLVNDVASDPDYISYDPETHSELSVPIKFGETILGAINIEHPELSAFDIEDQQALEALAASAALAVKNAQIYDELIRRYDDLRQIKGLVGSRTVLEWTSDVSKSLGHSINTEVSLALADAEFVRRAILQQNYSQALSSLLELENIVHGIRDIPMTELLSQESVVDSVNLHQMLKKYFNDLWKKSWYTSTDLELDLPPALDEICIVRASRTSLGQALKIILDNAIQAMKDADSPTKKIVIKTNLQDGGIEILIQDTGPGIPDKARDNIFEKPIEKSMGERGSGIGLLLAKTFIEAYQRGKIRVLTTGPSGTTIAIWLPLEDPQNLEETVL